MDLSHLSNPRAEQSFLGACLIDPEILDWADVSKKCFFDPRNQAVFEAIGRCRALDLRVDEVTIATQLGNRLDAVGGEPYLSELAIATPTADNAKSYLDLMHEKRVARELHMLAARVQASLGTEPSEEVLSTMMRKASAIERGKDDSVTMLSSAIRAEWISILEDMSSEEEPSFYLPTGFHGFDLRVNGIPTGVPSLLGALPGVGKSALALALLRQIRGVVFTYEDRVQIWAQRCIAEVANVNLHKIRSRKLSLEETGRVESATKHLRETFRLSDVAVVHAHGWKIDRLIRKAHALRNSMGARFFVVDYMQLMPNPDRHQFKTKADWFAENLRQFGDFAGQEDVGALMLWQLTREFAKSGNAPVFTDFADSSGAERIGKFIMALWEPPDDNDGQIELCLIKNSNGPEGNFRLPFDRPFMRIG